MIRINKKQKELIKIYLVLFALALVVINWNSVSWVFNYRALSGFVYDFFHPYQESTLLSNETGISIANAAQPSLVTAATFPYSQKANSLEVPAISLVTPLVIGSSTSIPSLERELDRGVVFYPGSVLPGEKGHMVILGHSAPPNWPKIKHDWVFTDLEDLRVGDQIFLHFNNTQYTYRVTSTKVIQKGEEITTNGLEESNNVLTLVSCWPPGKDYKRITVQAELVIN